MPAEDSMAEDQELCIDQMGKEGWDNLCSRVDGGLPTTSEGPRGGHDTGLRTGFLPLPLHSMVI